VNDDEHSLFMALRLGYCYYNVWKKCLNAFSDYTRPVSYFRSARVYLLFLFVGNIRGKGKTSLYCS